MHTLRSAMVVPFFTKNFHILQQTGSSQLWLGSGLKLQTDLDDPALLAWSKLRSYTILQQKQIRSQLFRNLNKFHPIGTK